MVNLRERIIVLLVRTGADLVVEVENPTGARVVRAVLKDLREKPAEYMES